MTGLSNGVFGFLVALLIALAGMGEGVAQSTTEDREQARVVPRNRAELLFSFSPVVKLAAPAVVNVYVRRRAKRFVSPFGVDPFFRHFLRRDRGRLRKRYENSLGSGVIVSPEGLVVTNYHVIKGGGGTEIKVALADKREFDAEVILQDEKTDLAILQIVGNGETFRYLDFEDSDTLEVGDIVLAIGNPFGVGQTVTSGIVSALARTKVGKGDSQYFIQTDAAINPGNSGGALVNLEGKIIGVNTMIFSRSGGSNGIGFAIPSNLVRLVVASAQSSGEVQRPWFGAKLDPITSDIANALGLERVAGAIVRQVYDGGAAAEAGIRAGDVVVSVDGRDIGDPRAFNYRFTTRPIGGAVQIGVVRNGGRRNVDVRLQVAPRVSESDYRRLEGTHPLSGVRVANLSPVLAEELKLATQSGVVITNVARGSVASRYRLRRSDIVLEINREPIDSIGQLEDVLTGTPRRWRITIQRGRRKLRLDVWGRG